MCADVATSEDSIFAVCCCAVLVSPYSGTESSVSACMSQFALYSKFIMSQFGSAPVHACLSAALCQSVSTVVSLSVEILMA